jgi:hypothetical protein
MKKFLTMALIMFALVMGAAQLLSPAVQAGPSAGATPQAGGTCSCPKGKVCCFNCDGSFAYCARSRAYCPECPAP